MTRLHAEADVRAMLVKAVHRGEEDLGRPFTAEEIADRLLALATPAAAPDLSRLAEAVSQPRREVRWFADLMERTLQANDHKGGWQSMTAANVIKRLREETDELDDALARLTEAKASGSRALVAAQAARLIQEACDVANFAMMLADNTGRRHGVDFAPIIAASGTDQERSEVEAFADGVQAGRATMARDAAAAAAAEAGRIQRTGRNHAARLACQRVADAIRHLGTPRKEQKP